MTRNATQLTETEIGDAVKSFMSSYSPTTYCWDERNINFSSMKHVEELGMRGGSCDLIYYDDSKVFAIELKRQLNMKVIAQAVRWLDIATGVYIATTTWLKPDAAAVLRALGVGYINVCGTRNNTMCRVQLYPQLLIADMDVWNRELSLIDKQDVPAGTKNGARSTTFSRFIARAKQFCTEHPEANLRMVAMQVKNHYSSIESCMGALKRYAHYGLIEKFWKD